MENNFNVLEYRAKEVSSDIYVIGTISPCGNFILTEHLGSGYLKEQYYINNRR